MATKSLNQLHIFNAQGKPEREFELPAAVQSYVIKPAVVHQVTVGLAANRRAGTAHTKNRAEVSGGGKKPWKQKGTGRARHGSIRSPQWVGGGVVFGPRNERNYTHRLTAKLRSVALAMVVADYLKSGKVTVVESFPEEPKTKIYANLLKQMSLVPPRRTLVLLTEPEASHRRGLKNIAGVTVMAVRNLSSLEGLLYPRWLVSAAGLSELLKFIR